MTEKMSLQALKNIQWWWKCDIQWQCLQLEIKQLLSKLCHRWLH